MTDRLLSDFEIESEHGHIHKVSINGKRVTGIRNVTVKYKPFNFPEVVITANVMNNTSLVSDHGYIYIKVEDDIYRLVPVESIYEDQRQLLIEVNKERESNGLEPLESLPY